MEQSFPECECFDGRKRKICRNEAGIPLGGKHGVNAYRKSWGFDLIPEKDSADQMRPVTVVKLPPPTKQPELYGVGSEVKKILQKLKVTSRPGFCECQSWINRMNEWGPQGCRERRKEILEHLDKEFDAASITTKVVALGMAIWNGIPLSLEGILDLAITTVESHVT